jgi:hypothetical protein
MQIIYEPHPVSPERKAELRAAGFKIIDARFAPEGEAPDTVTREGIAKMKRPEVVDLLEAHGAEIAEGASLADLRALLVAIMFVEA